METNEQRKTVMRAAIEEELERFFVQMQELREGDLEHLEEQVVKTSQQMGRSLLEGLLNSQLREQRPVARRQGHCGHRQRLVGERPKQLLTLLGPVTFVRPYYPCLDESCSHGEAPDDTLWGVQQQRTTSGVQREISYLCGRLTCEEAAESLCRHVPLGMSARQALSLLRPVGEALARAEDRQVKSVQVQAQQARAVKQQRRDRPNRSSGSPSNWMGCWHACAVRVCPWRKRNDSAKVTCIERSKPEQSFGPSGGPSVQS